MEVHQLKYFCAIARAGTFTRAAESMHVAQPSLSQQIHKLEDELGGKLFYRLPRHARLTPLGERFLPRALAILEGIREAKTYINDIISSERLQAGEHPIAVSAEQHRTSITSHKKSNLETRVSSLRKSA